jgi:acyl-coenzyme A thioesterase PaaI-like protein
MNTPNLAFATPTVMAASSHVWDTRRRIAEHLRALNDQLLTRDVSLDQLQALEQQLANLLPFASNAPDIHGRIEWSTKTADHGGFHLLSREVSPIAGYANAAAPPLHMWLDRDKGEAHAKITLGWTFEGPPKCVHGGWIAALFDEFMGCAQILSGQSGATGTLSVRYKKPTPLVTELTLFARIREVHGRKIIVDGTLSANGEVTASCEGLFISFAEGVTNLADRDAAKNKADP